jgi:NhaP-type Na+/H+ or K+/H+ antiporter
MNLIFALGIILLSGLIAALLIEKIKLPYVTGYIIMGIIIGPYVLNLIPKTFLRNTDIIANFVLSIVAFMISRNFSYSVFKKTGKQIIFVSMFEATGAWLFVTLGVFLLLHKPLYIALLFGALAAATDPASILLVSRQYRTKGPVTNVLLGTVAIDDAWGLIIFVISMILAIQMKSGASTNISPVKMILGAILEIVYTLGIGAAMGFIFSYLARFIRTKGYRLIYTLGFITLTAGIAMHFHYSPLLACMALGTVIVNFAPNEGTYFEGIEFFAEPLMLVLFILIGAGFELKAITTIGLIGAVYIGMRFVGKYLGASIGAFLSKAPKTVRKFVGLGLVPQAGVALGMAILGKEYFPQAGNYIMTVIVATTLVLEVIGPPITQLTFNLAGEIPKNREAKRK